MKINFEVTDTETGRVISRTFTGFCQLGLVASMKNFILHVSDSDILAIPHKAGGKSHRVHDKSLLLRLLRNLRRINSVIES